MPRTNIALDLFISQKQAENSKSSRDFSPSKAQYIFVM